MLITLDLDPVNETALRALCQRYRIEIQHYEKEGPAGGNPCFHLVVDTLPAALALVMFYFG